MKNLAKLIVISAFGLGALVIFLSSFGVTGVGSSVLAGGAATPTPANKATVNKPANMPIAANREPNTTSNTAPATPKPTAAPAGGGGGSKKIPKSFTLGKDSQGEWGEVAFDHDNHAFLKYSPDGKSVIGCVECHHSDQPKSAMKPPLVTSERDEILTMEVYQKSSQKVSECRACHFQVGVDPPEGKVQASVIYPGKTKAKELDNETAYHINCNTCHDDAYKMRPEVLKTKGFARGQDCSVCHKKNE